MGQVIRVKLSEPKGKMYAEFTGCIIQNLKWPGYMGKPDYVELRFLFNDEYNGFSKYSNQDEGTNCSKKNVIKHLSPYFKKIEFIEKKGK